MEFSFVNTYKKAEKDYGFGKSDSFKVQEGSNKIRIISGTLPYESDFKGQTNVKFLCWIIDRKDGRVKLYFMPPTIMKSIGDLQTDPEYAFSEVPMPYDIDIRTENAGSKEVRYSVIPSRNPFPITAEEQILIMEKPLIGELVQKLQKKQMSSHLESQQTVATLPPKAKEPNIEHNDYSAEFGLPQNSTDDIMVEDIPF